MHGVVGREIVTGPGVDVDHTIRGYHEMAGVTDAVGKDGGTESWRQFQTAVVAGTPRTSSLSNARMGRNRIYNRAEHREQAECAERNGNGENNSRQAERSHGTLPEINLESMKEMTKRMRSA